MLPIRELRLIARARLKDAELLKARICRTLKGSGFPSSPSDFQGLTSFRTHNLDVLPHLSGREETIKKRHMSAWSTFAMWDPEARYLPIGSRSEAEATAMLRSAQEVLSAL